MSGAAFRIARGVYIAGVRYRPGDVLTLTDAAVIADLLSTGRGEAADAETAARVRRTAVVSWTKGAPAELPPERDPWVRRHP